MTAPLAQPAPLHPSPPRGEVGRGGITAFSCPAEASCDTPSPVLSPGGRATGLSDRHPSAMPVDVTTFISLSQGEREGPGAAATEGRGGTVPLASCEDSVARSGPDTVTPHPPTAWVPPSPPGRGQESHRSSDALVVFCDGEKPAWVRLLRPGFRHVFVALRDGPWWVTVDPLCQRMEVQVQPVAPDMDLAAWFRAHGLTVVEAAIDRTGTRPAPVGPFTCVEAVKRVLGLRAPLVLTPWQLYRRLLRPS